MPRGRPGEDEVIMEGLPELGGRARGPGRFRRHRKKRRRSGFMRWEQKLSFYDVWDVRPDSLSRFVPAAGEIYSQVRYRKIHVPVLPETVHMVNWDVFKK